MKWVLMSICFFITLGVFSPVYAQALPLVGGTVNVRMSPESPAPGQTVTFTLESFSTNINSLKITWYINGKSVRSGIGEKVFVASPSDIGTSAVVSVVIILPDGQSVQKEFTIQPASVDLIWEAQSYTPPFYKGKAMYPYQGVVTIQAIPNILQNGVAIDRSKLIYTWRYNNSLANDASGYGKDTITIKGDVLFHGSDVSVSVSTPDGKRTAQGSVTLSPQNPEIVLYAENPLYGTLYNRALGNTGTLEQQEVTIRAVPYNFSVSGPHETYNLSYEWTINGTAASTPTASSIVLRKPDGVTKGTSDVGIKVVNNDALLQFANRNILITYTQPQ